MAAIEQHKHAPAVDKEVPLDAIRNGLKNFTNGVAASVAAYLIVKALGL
jgi:hypothetical protein